MILMRFYLHMFGTLFSISFVLYQFFFFFFGLSPAVHVFMLVGINHHCAVNRLTGHWDKS